MSKNIELSFTKGTPIARIEGGMYHNKIIHVYDPDIHKEKKCCDKCSDKCMKRRCCKECKVKTGGCCEPQNNFGSGVDPYDYINDNFMRSQKKRMTVMEMAQIKRALLLKKDDSLNAELSGIYKNTKIQLDDRSKKEIIIHDGEIRPLPNPDKNKGSRVYIAGSTGSGKSVCASKMTEEYKRMFPGNDFIVFSNENEDAPIDKLKPIRIKLDMDMVEKPIEKEELKDSLVLFDDIDAMQNKQLEKSVFMLRDNLMKEGRKHGIYVMCTAHQVTNYGKSRDVLNECDQIIFFPQNNAYGIKYYLQRHAGLSKQDVDKIINLPSRWVCYNKNYPGAILYASGVYLLGK